MVIPAVGVMLPLNAHRLSHVVGGKDFLDQIRFLHIGGCQPASQEEFLFTGGSGIKADHVDLILLVEDGYLKLVQIKLFREALEEMKDDSYIRRATFLLWVGHNLERIGDRATNIAERVIFMCTGEFIETQPTWDEMLQG